MDFSTPYTTWDRPASTRGSNSAQPLGMLVRNKGPVESFFFATLSRYTRGALRMLRHLLWRAIP